jgi:hypothetical protein
MEEQLNAVFLLELINSAAGIQELLLAGEERMAAGANFDAQLFLGRASFKGVAAGAGHLSYIVLGLNCCLHLNIHLSRPKPHAGLELYDYASYILAWKLRGLQ